MQAAAAKYLEFQCGPFRLVTDLDGIIEILAVQPSWYAASGSSAAHHRQPVAWRERELPFIDLRIALGLATEGLTDPHHALVLADSETGKACAVVAVDGVQQILDVAGTEWYRCQGLDPRLDHFFERLMPAADRSLRLCLAAANAWLPEVLQR